MTRGARRPRVPDQAVCVDTARKGTERATKQMGLVN